MSKKYIKVYFEVPTKWVDIESPLYFTHYALKNELYKALKDELIWQYIKKVELPDIKIDKVELKKAIIDKMADKIIEKNNVQ